MRISGKEVKNTVVRTVTIPRMGEPGIALKVRALPLGYEDKAAVMFPEPEVPIEYAQDADKRVLRDQAGNIVKKANPNDPAYDAAIRRCARLQLVFYIYYALKADPTVEFEADKEGGPLKETVTFYEAIDRELVTSGFTPGDIKLLMDCIMEISNMRGAAVKEAKERFLSGAPHDA